MTTHKFEQLREVDYELFMALLAEADQNGSRIRINDIDRVESFDGGVLRPLLENNGKQMRALFQPIKEKFGECKASIIGKGTGKGLYLYTVDSHPNYSYQYIDPSHTNMTEASRVLEGGIPRRTIDPETLERLFRSPSFLKIAMNSGKSSAEVFMSASDEEVKKWLEDSVPEPKDEKPKGWRFWKK